MTHAVGPGKETLTLYLPAGRWAHAWSGDGYAYSDGGTYQTVGAPVGDPPCFTGKAQRRGPGSSKSWRVQALLR